MAQNMKQITLDIPDGANYDEFVVESLQHVLFLINQRIEENPSSLYSSGIGISFDTKEFQYNSADQRLDFILDDWFLGLVIAALSKGGLEAEIYKTSARPAGTKTNTGVRVQRKYGNNKQ